MCNRHRRKLIEGSLAALMTLAVLKTTYAVATDEIPEKKWVCPPCGCDDDDKVFSSPGRCPACDEELIEKPRREPEAGTV